MALRVGRAVVRGGSMVAVLRRGVVVVVLVGGAAASSTGIKTNQAKTKEASTYSYVPKF